MNAAWTEEDCGLDIWDLMSLQLGDLCDMASGKSPWPMRSSKRADRFQSKVVASRNPKLVREAKESVTTKQTLPSPREMRQLRTTQLRDMGQVSHQKFSVVNLDQRLFQPCPSEVVFENYVPHQSYIAPLALRNKDRVPRLLNVILENSPYFELMSPSNEDYKVAPGMSSTFHILFRPDENKDYFHQLIIITEREKFFVPIRAIGARATLDFPEQLNFPNCPVKFTTQKTLLVRNVGNREACYNITTLSPFSVDPSIGTLGIGEAMQVTVEFHPSKTGVYSSPMIIHYDTGEDVHRSLYGTAVNVKIRLDKSSLTVEKTPLTLSNQRFVVIHNQSDITAHFQWKRFVDEEEEERQKLRLQRQEEGKLDDSPKEHGVVPPLGEHPSLPICTFQNQGTEVQGDSTPFRDDIFTIEPMEGDILPNSSFEINVIFKPKEARVYKETVYCDISGCETRLPLCISGEGIGPQVKLSCDQLSIGKVLVGSTHSYRVLLLNRGVIETSFSVVYPERALGSCFTFSPREGMLLPFEHQVIWISVHATVLGQFTEEFQFIVKGSPEPLTLTVSGCVTGPTFHFNVSSLRFGEVSFGFPCTLCCRLTNTSSVPFNFNLRIPGDGSGAPSVTSFAQVSDSTGPSWRKQGQGADKPAEFTIRPFTGTICSKGHLDIQVTLCSNTVKSYKLALVVDVDGVGKEVLSLPVRARCVIPSLRVLNPAVAFGRCSLKVPYQQMLTLVNDSNLPGCYWALPQENKDAAAVWYSCPEPRGIIQPHSSVEIPFTLEVQVTGKQDTVAHVAVFGSKESPLKIHLLSTGEGPVVHVHPSEINFGSIQVLQDASRALHLSNQSVIPASFSAKMAGENSCWSIGPSQGVIPAKAEVSVAVTANLNDMKQFKDKVVLFIENSRSYIIPVQAVGVGTTIVIDKPFGPELNLGPCFSLDPCWYRFKMTNKGRRTHLLYWTTEGGTTLQQCTRLPPISNTKGKVSSCRPVFKLQPLRTELMPGQTAEILLEGSCSTPKVVKEKLLCHAIVGNKGVKTLIMQVDVTCEFIAPALQISTREITFQVVKHPGDVLTLHYKPLSLKNNCSLPLSVVLALEQPFSICTADQQPLRADAQPMKLRTGEELQLYIRFNPAYEEDLLIRAAEKALKIKFLEHPHEEQVTVRGEVYFPNLQIQTTALDFGCILNDTKDVRYIEMTNCSPLVVQYHWLFLKDSQVNPVRFNTPAPKFSIEAQAPEEKGACSEHLASAASTTRGGSVEEPAGSLGSVRDPAQEPAHADDSLEAKVLPSTAVELEGASEPGSLVGIKDLMPFMETETLALGVEEVFDILPLHGELQPGQSQRVTFTFFGHANTVTQVTALCRVEGGPSYEVSLRGEASLISYLLDTTEIDCGLQVFNEVTEAAVTLQNRGKLGFAFVVLSPGTGTAASPLPGVPLVVPSTGYVEPGKQQVLKVYYLPGVPGVFCRAFQIQVGHLEPEKISVKGEGTFPRIHLDLPRNIKGNAKYEKILKKAKEKLDKGSQRDEAIALGEAVAAEPCMDDSGTMWDAQLQMQMEEMLIEEHALEQQQALASHHPEDTAFHQLVHRRLLKAELPEYILDFGYVIPGDIHTHIVKVTNTGHFPASFHADGYVLYNTGFSVCLDRVKRLPYCETKTFEVCFDPQSANLPLGKADVLLPIKVTRGPTFQVRLRAIVTEPSLCLSRDRLEFSAVQCGQCQEETMQLHNMCQVPCKWSISMNEPVKEVNKHLPASKQQKLLKELKAKPCVFEVLPSAGTLAPGQQCHVQVRFSPMEEKCYQGKLQIQICQSSQRLQVPVSGRGLEPRLEFSPAVLELEPLLPQNSGAEGTVVVKNPCEFPIEFYSLEFDQQYLAEEQILRTLTDYNSHNTLLLPPRAPGEKLPLEVLEYSEEQKRLQDAQDKSKTGEPSGQENGQKMLQDAQDKSKAEETSGQENAEHQQSPASSKKAVEELEHSQVCRAIACHLDTDISAEECAAWNRRGIVILVHGAPLAGKTAAAVALSQHYGAACLSIDAVVKKAISDRSSLAGLRARELCVRAAIEQSHHDTEDAGCVSDMSLSQQSSTAARHSPDAKRSRSWSKGSLLSFASQGQEHTAVDNLKSGITTSRSQHHSTDATGSQGSSSFQLAAALPCLPAQRWQSISGSASGELGFMSCVLPEDLLVAILSERLQLSDCYRGVVFDGLETPFACSTASALLCLLKAVRNRPHIYFVNLVQDYDAWKARETAAKEQEEGEQEEAARREKARLWEVDEDEYEALAEEQKAQLNTDIRQVQRERKKREMEQLAGEFEEKLQQELERLKEEELKKKSKPGKRGLGKDKANDVGRRSQPEVKQNTKTSTSNISNRSDIPRGSNRNGSGQELPDSVADAKKKPSKKLNVSQKCALAAQKAKRILGFVKRSVTSRSKEVPQTAACPAVVVQTPDPEQGEPETEAQSDREKNLALRFQIYEASQKDVAHILSSWDRVQGVLLSPLNQEEVQQQVAEQHLHSFRPRSLKDRAEEHQVKLQKKQLEKLRPPEDVQLLQLEGEDAEGSANGQDSGVPCLDVHVLSSEDVTRTILESSKLPAAKQVLDDLGLAPSGPPVPPTAFYSVIRYPEERLAPAGEALKHFMFIVPEGATSEEEKKTESLLGVPGVPPVKASEKKVTPARSHSRKEKAVRERRNASQRSVQGLGRATPPRPHREHQSSVKMVSTLERCRLSQCRWIVPAHGEVELKVLFTSTELGQFEQTLHFEILGTNRVHKVLCRGTCLYPTISQDPRVVFPHQRKTKTDDDIIFKQYVRDEGVFHFGPLLCGMSRDWYKALPHPSNCEKITILNITPLEAEVDFFFERDVKANTFLLDPPSMRLKPNEKQELSIWAYPASAGYVEDNLLCYIKDNPEPVVFRLCCQGVQVELGVSPKQVYFDRLLLHRMDSKTLVLQNCTPLPVAWQLSGLENLGKEFSVSQAKGVVGPRTEFGVQLYFKPTKALSIKKTLQLKVSDAENILGVVHTEIIHIYAEAYDVFLTIGVSKGKDDRVDFGILKVLGEAKQVLTLKNKGKYAIAYSFKLEAADTNIPNLASQFTVQPQQGLLPASKHPVQVQLLFHPKMEMSFEDKPILQCQVTEPGVRERGEIIAVIPVRVSARAAFSQYSIHPASLISFGAMVSGTSRTCSFVLQNKGILSFSFLIQRAAQDSPLLPGTSAQQMKPVHSQESTSMSKLQKDTSPLLQADFTVGMFTVSPGFGTIPPGGQQVISVECCAEPLGTCKELLSIDVSDRDPRDNPCGIPYTLMAESCLPAFVVDDIESIFEEHRICSSNNLCHILQTAQDKGIFIRDENKFLFTNVLVGHRATARFKIHNVGKVPCVVVLSLKAVPSKLNSCDDDNIFEVDPVQMRVPSCSHAFATVTFTPRLMQNYQCIFEASLDGQASPAAVKAQSLTFHISGDGNLPHMTVLCPALPKKSGNRLLLFKKLLLGDSGKLPLVLRNDGVLPVQLLIDLLDEEGVFSLKARPNTQCIYQAAGMEEDSLGEDRKPHTAALVLRHGELAEFDVLFKPNLAQRVEGKIHMSVVDNPYEKTIIQLVGEGYEDDFTLDNIHGLVADSVEEDAEGSLEEDTIEAARVAHIQFGDCHIGTPYKVTFTIRNHSREQAMRFSWLAEPPFTFSPQVGHLHAGCAKDITVTLKSEVAVAFRMLPVKCRVVKITFPVPPEQVMDWDDCRDTVQWVDARRDSTATRPLKKKKMIQPDHEPAHAVLEESSREVVLHLSAVVDYAEVKLDTDRIEFKETLLFQTRTCTFQLSNTGNVALEYTWMVAVGDERPASCAEELFSPSLDGNSFSSTCGASVMCQPSRCWSQPCQVLDHVSSSLSWSLNTGSATPLFCVEPCSGTIPAGQEQLFCIKFSPVHVGDFESCMFCRIPNLKPNQKSPEVAVKGRSLMSMCHFELEDSDYLTAKRRNPELPGPKGTELDLNTRVIEFAVTGLYSRSRRTFLVMNPTFAMYSFQWTCQDPEASPGQEAFFCLTERGQIQPGKKAEIKFEFIPRHLDVTESFWVFTIPEHSISVPVLLVGKASDPLVTLDRAHLNLERLLIGNEVHRTVYLINSEKEAFSFSFRESSLLSEGCKASVKVMPLADSIDPLSRLPITIFYTPILEGEVVFNLKCDVKGKMQPLPLNIKATGCSMNVSVRCEDSDGRVTELSAHEVHVIDLQEVQLNEKVERIFHICNPSKFSFSYSWKLSSPTAHQQLLSITPAMGTVRAEGKAETRLAFHPQKMCSLKDIRLTLQISQGPTFTCVLLASVVAPAVHFSTTRLSFGACFIYCAGMTPAQQTLVISNKANKDMSLNCLFTNTMHIKVDFPACVLRPGGTVEVPITFCPREEASYHELIPFEINGFCKQTVEVRGRGTEMKVDVVDPPGKVVKLGNLCIGQTVKKIVTIANNSAAPLTCKLRVTSTVAELQEAGVLCLKPTKELKLKPRGDTCKVEVTFSPKHHIQPFTGEVLLECSGLVRSLFVVRGSCQGSLVSLNQDHLSFGAVVQQSYTCRRVVMRNTGDAGVKFMWDMESFKPDFSISPTKGYISPGMDIPFVVTFRPSKLSQAVQYEGLQCFIQGSEPLRLTLAGSCVEAPGTKETLTFTCNVRETQSQTILLSNPSSEAWTLQPIIEGEYWKGPEFFHLEAKQQEKAYQVTYRPLTMSSEDKKHQGSIFFPLPDGTGLHYRLEGTAEAPRCSGTISREVPCRNSHTELIPVSNWLHRPQRFLVVIDMLKPENLESSSVLQGCSHIDVPSSAKKDYQLTFFSYKEGVFNAKVTFLNETTGEYLFHMVTFKAMALGPIGTVKMSTAVRQRVSSTVKVDNPLRVPVTFNITCKAPDVSVPQHFTVPAQSKADLVLEYQPLKTGESTGHLVLQSSDLGSLSYNLQLKATSSRPEKPVYFRTMLGSCQTITTKIWHFAQQETEYLLQTDCDDFQTAKSISAAPASAGGSEVNVEVTFEPCHLGEAKATLQLSSTLGGQYCIPLIGLALPPEPQGPFLIPAGGTTSISFRNVFPKAMAFQYSVKHPAFTVRAPEMLHAKSSTTITVSFTGGLAPVASRLVVSCPGGSWVYYLRGLPSTCK